MNAFARGGDYAARLSRSDEAGGGVPRVARVVVCLLAIFPVGPLSKPALGNGGRFEPALESTGEEIGDLPAGEFPSDGSTGSIGEAFAESPFMPRHEPVFFPSQAPACRDCPAWAVQIDALMLWQGAIPSRPLYHLDSATRATVLDANDLQTPVTIDPRYAIIYHADDCRSLEVNYFNLWGFEGQAVAPPVAGGYEMNDLAGLNFTDLDTAEATSQAAIKSLEFNLRRRGWGGIEWLTGFRWVEWNQQLVLADTFDQGVGFDIFDISTNNNLYGWQWGGDMMLWNRGDRLRINGVAKAGVYYNHQASQHTVFETDRPNAKSQSVGDADDTVAFVGETGVMASYSLTNWLAIRLGYTFFWLGGVATPPDQLDASRTNVGLDTPSASVGSYGSVFLQGVQTGVEARW